MTDFILIIVSLVVLVVSYVMYAKLLRPLSFMLKQKQAELVKVRSELNDALPGLNEGLATTYVVDRENLTMRFFDNACVKRFGFGKSDWGVRDFRAICHEDCVGTFEKWIHYYNSLHDAVCRRLYFHLSTDGGKTYHWWELIYMLNKEEAVERYMNGIFVNIDDVRRMEDEIQQAQGVIYGVEMKETLLAAINHDLRTPLNAVAGFATLLAEQYDMFSAEERQEFGEIIKSNGASMLTLLDDLKSTSTGDIDTLRFKQRRKSVTELIRSVYNTNKMICPANLSLLVEIPDTADCYVNIDPKRVEQVLNNFLSNAFKFTPLGSVTIGWRLLEESNEAELYVSDTGVGVSDKNKDKVFSQFYKIDEKAKGTGLGLNTSKKIVEKLDGTIGLESTLGKGSKFYCRFKCVE